MRDITVPALTYELSADAGESFDPDDGPWTISGIAVAPGDILHDPEGNPVLMTEDELRKAAETQSDQPLSKGHPTDDNGDFIYPPPPDETAGKVVAAGYIDKGPNKRGVGYKARVHDPEIARGFHAGNIEVSIHPKFEDGGRDSETGAIVAESISFQDLAAVSKGDSPSNTANWGASQELAAWANQADIGSEIAATAGKQFAPNTEVETDMGMLEALGRKLGLLSPDNTLAAEQDIGPIQYDGTKTGSLDESEIPTDNYRSHYIFARDTKSDSGFPVVDADGNLRRGNVDSAWKFKSDAPVDEERFAEYLRDLATEFDDPPISEEDVEELEAAAQSSDEPAESGSDADNTDSDTTTMSDRETQINALVETHGFEAETLEAWDDDQIETTHSNLVDPDDNPGGDVDDDTGNVVEVDIGDYDSFDEYVQAEAEQAVASASEESDRQELIATIADRTDKSEDDLSEWPLDALEDKAETLTTSAQLHRGTGRHTGTVAASASNESESDLDAYGTGVEGR